MRERCRGGALLAVLWLSAALGAIAFSLAVSVRGETERTATALDSVRGYYLAEGAVQRAVLYMQWGRYNRNPDGTSAYYDGINPNLTMTFPGGEAAVRIVPESAKLNLNMAKPEELFRLLVELGAGPERAGQIVAAVMAAREPVPLGPGGDYSLLAPTFGPRHASFEEIEELLTIPGMTPELFYGTYQRDRQGKLTPRGALRDCVTVYGAQWSLDANTAEPAAMAAIGVEAGTIAAIVAARPIRSPEQLSAMVQGSAAAGRLRLGGNSIFTVSATGRPRLPGGALSDARRTVAAVVKRLADDQPERFAVLRWYDSVWAQ